MERSNIHLKSKPIRNTWHNLCVCTFPKLSYNKHLKSKCYRHRWFNSLVINSSTARRGNDVTATTWARALSHDDFEFDNWTKYSLGDKNVTETVWKQVASSNWQPIHCSRRFLELHDFGGFLDVACPTFKTSYTCIYHIFWVIHLFQTDFALLLSSEAKYWFESEREISLICEHFGLVITIMRTPWHDFKGLRQVSICWWISTDTDS